MRISGNISEIGGGSYRNTQSPFGYTKNGAYILESKARAEPRAALMATEFFGVSDLRLRAKRLVWTSPRLRWDSRRYLIWQILFIFPAAEPSMNCIRFGGLEMLSGGRLL